MIPYKNTQHVIPDECVDSYPEEFKQTREFKEAHTILYWLRKDDPLGTPPSSPEEDPMFNSWEAAVQNWAKDQEEYVTEDMEYEDCNLRSADQTPEVTITYPADGGKLTSTTWNIKTSIAPGTNRNTKMVEYIIDGHVVSSSVSSPFASSYTPSTLTSGIHELTVRVTNDRDNTSSDTINFRYTADSDNSSNNNDNSNKNSNKNSSKKKKNN